MKITKEELVDGLPLALMLMYLAYKLFQEGQMPPLKDFILTNKDNGVFYNKYMH